ncbi:MAG: hemerythrin family protein [Gammaproteobacteria bacterium]|jgi:hemerythrin|nr:hemerythrin family protein [Gammaproteobacteria bacterium]MBT4607885.1 hemerythrin family protein [Thiotrichales bacterium]MBT3472052.1 hemerythrin family protein [Gammaproteobacteria bacterium]MBT3967317.1 hemerythrin family protein [Gammaproteobacteria bacterium]MBT4080489.1 hemerythrin family protein [Gammaproteobacteria bacterium]
MKKSYSTFGLFSLIIVALITIFLGFLFGMDNPLPWIVLAVLAIIPYMHERKIRREYIDWSDKYMVGIELIDHDHQKLVGLLNQVVSAANFNMGDSYVRSVISEVVDYTKYHFDREEGLMRDNGYPGLEEHQVQHRSMIEQVEKFSKRIEERPNCEDDVCMEIYRFLKSWLINHITHTDKEVGKYLLSKGQH